MVTLPTEAASEYEMVREIIERGATCLRINCAHDNPSIWEKMIQNIRQAEQELSCQCTVMMDLGGPKIRTEMVLSPAGKNRVFRGDLIVLCRSLSNQAIADPIDNIHISCTVPEILDLLKVGTLVYIDDGKLRTRVVDQVLGFYWR
jgi:pyruvate kinase